MKTSLSGQARYWRQAPFSNAISYSTRENNLYEILWKSYKTDLDFL